jgi:hypothetical protein
MKGKKSALTNSVSREVTALMKGKESELTICEQRSNCLDERKGA